MQKKKRNAEESDLNVGDKVSLKEDKENKLSTEPGPSPYRMCSKNGNSV